MEDLYSEWRQRLLWKYKISQMLKTSLKKRVC